MIINKGDITTAQEGIIVHGCNAQGVMGSGVARAVKCRWPGAFEAYKKAERSKGLMLGDISYAFVARHIMVVNAVTQQYYGRDGRQYVDYQAVRDSMTKINALAYELGGFKKLHFPKLGAGLGGGKWDVIQNIIKEEVTDLELNLWEL